MTESAAVADTDVNLLPSGVPSEIATAAPFSDHDYSSERTAAEIIADIDLHLESQQRLSRPQRIRATEIGYECGRRLAYSFLWATPPKAVSGRMLRLFEDGNKAEPELLGYLRAVGYEVIERDPANPNKQIWVEFLEGHGGGYVDGVARDRARKGPWRIVECKTHGDSSFKKLLRDKVELSKPEHAGQFSMYAWRSDLGKALYIAKNKNDSAITIELLDVSETYVKRLIERAELIISKTVLPPKIGVKPTSHKCKFCAHTAVCHESAVPDRNCRTCQHSKALPGGTWGCQHHKCEITKALQPVGCADYKLHELFEPAESINENA